MTRIADTQRVLNFLLSLSKIDCFPNHRSSPPEVFFKRGLKICIKFTGKHPTPIPKYDFNKVAKQLYWNRTAEWCSQVNLLHIFKTPFDKNTSGGLPLTSCSPEYREMLNFVHAFRWSIEVLQILSLVILFNSYQKSNPKTMPLLSLE